MPQLKIVDGEAVWVGADDPSPPLPATEQEANRPLPAPRYIGAKAILNGTLRVYAGERWGWQLPPTYEKLKKQGKVGEGLGELLLRSAIDGLTLKPQRQLLAGAIGVGDNLARLGITAYQRLRGQSKASVSTTDAGRMLDQAVDTAYRGLGLTPPSEMTASQRSYDQARRDVVSSVGVGLGAASWGMRGFKAAGKLGKAARLARTYVLEEVGSNYLSDNTGGNLFHLINGLAGKDILPTGFEPGEADMLESANKSLLPNASPGIAGYVGSGVLRGAGSMFNGIRRRKAVADAVTTTKNNRKALEQAGVVEDAGDGTQRITKQTEQEAVEGRLKAWIGEEEEAPARVDTETPSPEEERLRQQIADVDQQLEQERQATPETGVERQAEEAVEGPQEIPVISADERTNPPDVPPVSSAYELTKQLNDEDLLRVSQAENVGDELDAAVERQGADAEVTPRTDAEDATPDVETVLTDQEREEARILIAKRMITEGDAAPDTFPLPEVEVPDIDVDAAARDIEQQLQTTGFVQPGTLGARAIAEDLRVSVEDLRSDAANAWERESALRNAYDYDGRTFEEKKQLGISDGWDDADVVTPEVVPEDVYTPVERDAEGRVSLESEGVPYALYRGDELDMNMKLLEVDIDQLDAAWRADEESGFYIGRGAVQNPPSPELQRAFADIEQGMAAGDAMQAPATGLLDGGRVGFDSGAPLVAYMRDTGKKKMFIAVDERQLEEARQRFGAGAQRPSREADVTIDAEVVPDQEELQAPPKRPRRTKVSPDVDPKQFEPAVSPTEQQVARQTLQAEEAKATAARLGIPEEALYTPRTKAMRKAMGRKLKDWGITSTIKEGEELVERRGVAVRIDQMQERINPMGGETARAGDRLEAERFGASAGAATPSTENNLAIQDKLRRFYDEAPAVELGEPDRPPSAAELEQAARQAEDASYAARRQAIDGGCA